MSSAVDARSRPGNLPAGVGRVVDVLATHRGRRGVVLGGGRGESGDLGPGRDWDLLVYVDAGDVDPVAFADAVDGLHVTRTPHTPFVRAEGSRRLDDGDTVEVLFIDAGLVRRSIEDSRRGRFRLYPMTRLVSGMPSYVLEAEVALGIALGGAPPPAPSVPPEPLVARASRWWHGRASLSYVFAGESLDRGDDLAARAHLLAAAHSYAHMTELKQGWYLPSKRFVTRTLRAGPDGEQVLRLLREPPAPETVRALGAALGLSETAGLAWADEGREQGLA